MSKNYQAKHATQVPLLEFLLGRGAFHEEVEMKRGAAKDDLPAHSATASCSTAGKLSLATSSSLLLMQGLLDLSSCAKCRLDTLSQGFRNRNISL